MSGLKPRPVAGLLRWFRTHRRDLPWRRNRNAYRVWVSEVMLQQTRVETVIPYYRRFLRRFPTVAALARAREDAVLKMWEGLGYYSRARNLHHAARLVMAELGGRIPATPETFGRLPGAGPYITAAVMSIAYGHPLPAADGNVLRVMARYLAIRGDVRTPHRVDRIRRILAAGIPRRTPGAFNEAMMELGATVCTPVHPTCSRCPLRSGCAARRGSLQNQLPVRRKARPLARRYAAVAVVLYGDRILIRRRPSTGLLGGLWELPGMDYLNRKPGRTTLRLAMERYLGLPAGSLRYRGTVNHSFSHFHLETAVFAGSFPRSTNRPGFRRVSRSALGHYAMSTATHKALSLCI